MLGHGEPDIGGELLRLPEIGIGGLSQALAFERHHTLITLSVRSAVDGHGEVPLAEELGERAVALPDGLDALRREARIATQAAWHLVIGDEQIDRTVGRGLEDELALEFERGA